MNNSSISILYYTCNRIPDFFANNVRNHLLESSGGSIPIISISQKPIDFGKNICMEELISSIYNVYRQILTGAKVAKTKYVACCEDDSIYFPDHFNCRPPNDETFLYNVNRWRVYKNMYLYKHRRHPTSAGMWNCIASTAWMIKTLEVRFEKYPVQPDNLIGWGEPGRSEVELGLPYVSSVAFRSDIPNITFSHRMSLGGVRRVNSSDIVKEELPYWGNAQDLWNKFYG